MRLPLLILSIAVIGATLVRAQDWPMWGHDPSRNMLAPAANLPATFEPGKMAADGAHVDLATTKGVKWVAKLGSQSFGNPVVAAGRIFLGTNNDPGHDPKVEGDRGVLLCLDQATGKFLWQLALPKLEAGDNCDFQNIGICCSPAVEAGQGGQGGRVYLISNRCQVMCLDASGDGRGQAKIIWQFDLRDELGVFPNQASSGAVLIVGQRLYLPTCNGRDWTRKHIPAPHAPALICLDKTTGQLLGQERSGISARTIHCNWSPPALATIDGQPQIIFAGDDGFCYGFDPTPDANGTLKELWRFDCNPPEYRMKDGKPLSPDVAKGPCGILATPVVANQRIYVAIGQEPEHGDGAGCLACIDPHRRGDITSSGMLWRFTGMGRSLSTVAVDQGLLYTADFAGNVYCLDAITGKLLWQHDTEAEIWGSPLLADGKVYIGNQAGKFTILAAARQEKVLAEVKIEASIVSSAVAADGVLYLMTDKQLYAVGK